MQLFTLAQRPPPPLHNPYPICNLHLPPLDPDHSTQRLLRQQSKPNLVARSLQRRTIQLPPRPSNAIYIPPSPTTPQSLSTHGTSSPSTSTSPTNPHLTTYHNTTTTTPLPRHTDLLTSPAFHHLLTNPSTHLIITFLGNAGHLASSHRPTTHQHLLSLSTPAHPIHVLTFDYRGFGLSTGSPTESGLIADAVALLHLADGGWYRRLPPSPCWASPLARRSRRGRSIEWTRIYPDK